MLFFRKVKLMIQGLLSRDIFVSSSSLTFYTLLSLVPALALAFGIAKGFNLEGFLEDNIRLLLSSHAEVADYLIQFSSNLLDNTKEELIAGIGVLLLIWSAMSLLNNVEYSFNLIWKVNKQRPFRKKALDYVALFFLAPLFLILSATSTRFLLHKYIALNIDSPVIMTILHFAPVLFLWVLFVFLYRFLPYTRVRFIPSFFAGALTACLIFLFQWAFITFFVKLMNYGVIYGSFAALPLFLIWVNMNWIFILEGCKVCYYLQNFRYLLSKPFKKYSLKSQWSLLCGVVAELAKQKQTGSPHRSLKELSKSLKIPSPLLNEALLILIDKEWVAISTPDKKARYSLLKSSEEIGLSSILTTLLKEGDDFPGKADIQSQISSLLQSCQSLAENGLITDS